MHLEHYCALFSSYIVLCNIFVHEGFIGEKDTIEADLDENKCVIMMRPYTNQFKNLAHVISAYIPESLLPKSRNYIEPILMESIDHTVSKAFLQNNTTALNYYVSNFLNEPSETVINNIDLLEELNRKGFLTRILIPEYENLSQLYPSSPNNTTYKESIELFECIQEYALKNEQGKKLEGEGIFKGDFF